MTRAICIAVLLFFSSLSFAEAPTFADIRWGASKDDVRKQLVTKGFTPGVVDKDCDFKFEGTLVGYKAQGLAFFGNDKLVKFIIRIITPDKDAIKTYRAMKDVLSNKYGSPDNQAEYFKKPYYDGDGYEEQALKLGKATFMAIWGKSLMLEIHESLTVQVLYESDAWSEESAKRKARSTSVF